jgi:hypothetical protein
MDISCRLGDLVSKYVEVHSGSKAQNKQLLYLVKISMIAMSSISHLPISPSRHHEVND